MNSKRRRATGLVSAAILSVTGLAGLAWPQSHFDNLRREQCRDMLRMVSEDIRKHYYDPKFHGIDFEARVRQAGEKIQSATSLGDAFAAIAGLIEWLHDSHTRFYPPDRPLKLDYGYEMEMVGDACFITQVRPKTDAQTKVKIGDQVLTVEGFRTDRVTLDDMMYYFHRFAPRPSLHLLLRAPDGSQRTVEVQPKMREGKRIVDLTGSSDQMDVWNLIREEESLIHLLRHRYEEMGDKLMIWKMPLFDLNDGEVDKMFDRARKHQTLILDLRGNGGGDIRTLQRMVGNVIDHDVKIADRIGRKENKPQMAKTRGKGIFTGKLIVLTDYHSASASELFARMMQLERRGTVIGDRSSGSVMEAGIYREKIGVDTVIFFATEITDADLIMTDGKSLEHTGVTPDTLLLPTAEDLAAGRDPVLARAAKMAGVEITPEEAGKLFPFEWSPM